jgi:sodium/bile acid cotransporter 7
LAAEILVLTGLILITGITLADRQERFVRVGRWLKAHRGPDMVIFTIFFFSGLTLDSRMLSEGLDDLKATLAAWLSFLSRHPFWPPNFNFFNCIRILLPALFAFLKRFW